MRTTDLIRRSLRHYWRTNLAVVLGVATATAVLAGALLVGDSVRASLRDLFLLRIGNTGYAISAAGFFREGLADDLRAHQEFARAFDATTPLIALEGVVTHEASGRRGSEVQVYGVDDRFWRFHGRAAEGKDLGNRDVLLSASLADELGAKGGDAVLLRVARPSEIPVESLHGRKDDVGRTLRLSMRGALPAAELGEFSLRPQQGAVRAIYVPLRRLQRDLGQEGKINTVLVSEREPTAQNPEATAAVQLALIGRVLRETYRLEDLGIKLRPLEEQQALSLESESALINDTLAETARATATRLGMRAAPVLTYLANTMRTGGREVPYSLVTAVDQASFQQLLGSAETFDPASQPAPIILNDWAAGDLGARVGDVLTLEYYLWQDGGLVTATAEFVLAGIMPMAGAAVDRDLAPEYPGITESDSLSDWDPPFPLDLGRVRPIDEQYWDKYRTAPKAFIPLERGQQLWSSRYGKLTSVRLLPGGGELQSAAESYRAALKAALDPTQAGLAVYPARAQGLAASRGATDFGEYFTYFSFFLVVSALLLTGLFFKLGVEQRLREVGLLRAVGFPAGQIRRIFLSEGVVLAATGSVLGLAGALGYAGLMMLGLRTWWVDAVGTRLLALYVSPTSLILGAVGGLLVALGCIVWALRALARSSPRSLLAGLPDTSSRRNVAASPRLLRAALALILLGGLLLGAAALQLVGQVAGFFGAGTLLLAGLICYLSSRLRRGKGSPVQGHGWWPVSRLGFRNTTYRPGRSVLCITLIASATFIIVAVDAFRRDRPDVLSDRKSGAGGFPLLAQSLLPLAHDPNSAEGRESLNLPAAPDDAALRGVTFTRFRVRPGDDASCLNLYQPRNPRLLAPPADFLKGGRFSFQGSLAATPEEKANPWLLLEKEPADGVVPVIADANSMTYVLHLKLGEELVISQEGGRPVRMRLVAALADSIFQGELLMAERHFLRLFPEQEGYRFFLLDAPPEQAGAVAAVLEERLSDFGFDVMSTEERLAGFHRVENTYLSTFQSLGALGLLLGTVGLAAVLLRNVLERRRELALLRAVGYNSSHFALMALAENVLLLFAGLAIGAACALLAIAPAFFARGGRLPTWSLGLLLLAVLVTGLASSLLATLAMLRSPLLPALRAE